MNIYKLLIWVSLGPLSESACAGCRNVHDAPPGVLSSGCVRKQLRHSFGISEWQPGLVASHHSVILVILRQVLWSKRCAFTVWSRTASGWYIFHQLVLSPHCWALDFPCIRSSPYNEDWLITTTRLPSCCDLWNHANGHHESSTPKPLCPFAGMGNVGKVH